MPKVPAAPPCAVTLGIEDRMPVGLGDIVAVGLPGHTPGSVGYYVPSRHAIFVGDVVATVNGRAIVGPFNVDRAMARSSFGRVAALDVDVVAVGHGEPILSGARQLMARTVAWLESH